MFEMRAWNFLSRMCASKCDKKVVENFGCDILFAYEMYFNFS